MSIKNDRIDGYCGVRTAAITLGVTAKTVSRWVEKGKLEGEIVFGKMTLPAADVLRVKAELNATRPRNQNPLTNF